MKTCDMHGERCYRADGCECRERTSPEQVISAMGIAARIVGFVVGLLIFVAIVAAFGPGGLAWGWL